MHRHWTTLALTALLGTACDRTGDVLPPESQRDCYTSETALRYDLGRYWCRWGRDCFERTQGQDEAWKDLWEEECLIEVEIGLGDAWVWPSTSAQGCADGCRAWACIEALASGECTSDTTPQECYDMFGWTQEVVDSNSYGGRASAGTCPNPVEDP